VTVTIHTGDCRDVMRTLPAQSVHTCISSPPYFGLRDYGVDGQIGLESIPDCLGWATGERCGACFVCTLVDVYREVWRVLRDDGTCWVNLGDSYASTGGQSPQSGKLFKGRARQRDNVCISARIRTPHIKPKNLMGMPWRVALAMQADGWYLRQDIIWSKPNPMPESVRDRCTKAHEYLFLLSKSPKYYFDAAAIAEPASPNTHARLSQNVEAQIGSDRAHAGGKTNGRNKRSVWTVATKPYSEAHFATFPPALIEPCVLAGCPAGGIVLDHFGGSGTTGEVAESLGRNAILIELNPSYAQLADRRTQQGGISFPAEATS